MPEIAKLFYLRRLSLELQQRDEAIKQEINSIQEDEFLNAGMEDILIYIDGRYRFVPLELHLDRSSQEPIIEVARYVAGSETYCGQLRVSIPFTGSSELWNLQPSRNKKNYPSGEISCSEGDESGILCIEVTAPHYTENNITNNAFQSELELVRFYVQAQVDDLSNWHNSLPEKVENLTRLRKDRLLKYKGLSEMIGIPVRPHPDAPFMPIGLRRRLVRPLPSSPPQGYEAEPGIAEEDYVHILNVIRHESRTFETIPSTVAKLNEEDLRSILLVHLNGHYEGAATGETFRGVGKTDIRIESHQRSAFVAECKIWSGTQGLIDAIDQLRRYLTWRDCKTALIFFNKKNKSINHIKSAIKDGFESHACFQRSIPLDVELGEGEWEFSMASMQDNDRLLRIHVFLFNCYYDEVGVVSPDEPAPTHPSPPSTPPPDPAPTSPAPPGPPRRDP
jgi:hypothetical protein